MRLLCEHVSEDVANHFVGLALFILVLRWKSTVLNSYVSGLSSMVAQKRGVAGLGDDSGKLFFSFREEAGGSGKVTTLRDNPLLHDRNNSEAEALFSKISCANWRGSLKIPLRRDLLI